MDSSSGYEIMRSPELIGQLQQNSVHLLDLDNNGVNEVSYGTSFTMNISR